MSFQGRRLVEPAGRRLFSPTWKWPSQGPASRMASTMLSSSMFMWKVSSSTRAWDCPGVDKLHALFGGVEQVLLEAVDHLAAVEYAAVLRHLHELGHGLQASSSLRRFSSRVIPWSGRACHPA